MYSVEPKNISMVQAVEISTALKRCRWPCVQDRWVVDTASGCSFGCLFCPVRWRGLAEGQVQVHVNVPDLLKRELKTRARDGLPKPEVIINASTDSFQPVQAVLAVTYQSLENLLSEGCNVHLRTRGEVPEGFGDLLKHYADQVNVEVTFFSMDNKLASLYEPGAPPPQRRLDSVRRLRAWGLKVRARIQPLVPFITDTVGHLEELVRHLRSVGIERTSASYLVLRPQVLDRLHGRLPHAHLHLIKGSFKGTAWRKVGLHQLTRVLVERTRRQGYARLGAVAERAGLNWHICACQNPDMGRNCFADLKSEQAEPCGQLDLFPSAS